MDDLCLSISFSTEQRKLSHLEACILCFVVSGGVWGPSLCAGLNRSREDNNHKIALLQCLWEIHFSDTSSHFDYTAFA